MRALIAISRNKTCYDRYEYVKDHYLWSFKLRSWGGAYRPEIKKYRKKIPVENKYIEITLKRDEFVKMEKWKSKNNKIYQSKIQANYLSLLNECDKSGDCKLYGKIDWEGKIWWGRPFLVKLCD